MRTLRQAGLAVTLALAFALPAAAAGAQEREEVEELLQSQQLNAQQVRERIRSSGLSTQQVRERLRARGLSESILDPYLSGAAGGSGGAELTPSRDVLAAVEVLGQAQQGELDASARVRPSPARGPTSEAGLPVFGLDVFRTATNQFEPNLAGPVDPNYRLGALDVVVIILTGQVELSHTLEVTRDGFIVIPQVGQVFVANLTLAQATRVITQKLQQSYSGAGTSANAPTQVYVGVARLRTNQVFVLGEVSAPGSYQVSAAGTALTALYAAGGPTIRGTLRAIEVRRGGQVVSALDLYDYLLKGDATRDVRLENGDIVFVGVVPGRVGLTGEVVRPARYELKAGETLADAVRFAGGVTPEAARERVQVSRVLPPAERQPGGRDRRVFDVLTPELARGVVPATPVVPEDQVTVLRITDRVRGVVNVSGNVWTPGRVAFEPGLTLAQALRRAGGTRPDTYGDEVVISRLQPDETRQVVRARLDAAGVPTPDVALADEDEITVYSRTQFRPARSVAVGGAVNAPTGSMPFTEGMSLRSAILAAGGLRETALITEVEIARMPTDRSGGQLATVFRVAIDSTYLFERGPDGKYLGPPGGPVPTARAQEFALQPYDQVNVLFRPEFEYPGTVGVSGEIRFPGAYAIRTRGERLRDVLERAGGLTDRADVDAIVFRRAVEPADRAARQEVLARVRREREYASTAERLRASGVLAGAAQGGNPAAGAAAITQSAEQENAALQAILGDEAANERVAIDVRAVLRDRNHRDNVVVQAGDQLLIPRYSPTVAVRGFVAAPTTLGHRIGRSLKDYVYEAGGPTANADLKRSFVVQPSGRVEAYRARWWWFDRVPTPGPGALVVVPPKEVEVRVADNRWLAAVSGLATVAAAAAALVSVSR
jgi:protein involved in polysaccharide export with SLBB domain